MLQLHCRHAAMRLGPVNGRGYLGGWEEPSERLKIMSIQPFRQNRRDTVSALAAYYSTEPVPLPAPRLRPLTALEQMYAYWGSDQA